MFRFLRPAFALAALLCLNACVLSNPVVPKASPLAEIIAEPEAAAGPIQKMEYAPDTWIYRHPTKSPRDYAKVELPPVEMYLNMSSEVKKRDRRYLDEVGSSFLRRVQRSIEKDYLPVQKPDELTLRIEISLSQLQPTTRLFKDRHERIKLGRAVSGTKLEASCYDGVTHELVFAVTTFYKGDEYAAYENPVLIKNIRGAFGEWSGHFKKEFDAAMAFN